MATRCSIKIEGVDFAKVYVHWDGYPEHMLPWLTAFNEQFTANRGFDPEYKFAQLLRFSAKHEEEFDLDKSDETGYWVIPYDEDYGVNYEYTLKNDGSVEVK